jgi:major membrane immunogen (membrane-anchored lipoprotein)|tara:strand:+ start:2556 stop:2765 length:210 start_codon:yes stop_codon:yes gene_type:complete
MSIKVKKISILIFSLSLLSSCSSLDYASSTINETVSTSYESLKDGAGLLKKSIISGYDKAKSKTISEED